MSTGLRRRRVKKVLIIALAAMLLITLAAVPALADKGGKKAECDTIQDGTIYASTGELLTTGYDEFGYNYQAHMFNGRYCDYDRVIGGAYCDVELIMKWNDAWLSNMDCDGDGSLDRHNGFVSYIGSGAWTTNHMTGLNPDGSRWAYFVKIVAAPADAYKVPENANGSSIPGTWYSSDDVEIGYVIWSDFAVIQEIEQGVLYKSPSPVGFGYYMP